MTFKIFTPCNIESFNGSLDAVKRHVEQNAPLKKEWRGEWSGNEYLRINSKGAIQHGLTVSIKQLD